MDDKSLNPDSSTLLHAVLIPPQLERFRAITGAGDAPLEVDFTGWRKHVILAPDRVFLFPRHAQHVPILEREAAIYEALSRVPVAVPHLLARYHDDLVSPYPFLAVTRLRGVRYGTLEPGLTLNEVEWFLAGLGRLVAAWHNLDVSSLPSFLQPTPAGWGDPEAWMSRALAPGGYVGALEEIRRLVASYLHLPHQEPSRRRFEQLLSPPVMDLWRSALAELVALAPVLAHRDLHEDQLLVAGSTDLTISGVLDWETAGVDNPLRDFDFGEWGYGIWAWVADFARLRRAMWEAYAGERRRTLPHWTRAHLFFCLQQVGWLLRPLAGAGTAPLALSGAVDQLQWLAEATDLCAAHKVEDTAACDL